MDRSIRIVYRSTLYQNLGGTGRVSVDCRVLILINAWNTFKVNALVVIVKLKYDSLGKYIKSGALLPVQYFITTNNYSLVYLHF